MKVCKFGGSSLSDANQIKKFIAIVKADPERRFVVVSAPGKRSPSDEKITDLFYRWHQHKTLSLEVKETKNLITDRFAGIIQGLGIKFDLAGEIDKIEKEISEGATEDYVASRGEYLMAKIMALALGYDFLDAADCISLDKNGDYFRGPHEGILSERKNGTVIPGFYGTMLTGQIKTFSRGGSDVTGAIIARTVCADVYENWTDVDGVLMADPRVINNPHKIDLMTYGELRMLSYMGANVFHEEAMFPVEKVGIPTYIRNTNNLSSGTLILSSEAVAKKDEKLPARPVTGIAGKQGFTVISLHKTLMSKDVNFLISLLSVLKKHRISVEHMPSAVDSLSIIMNDVQLDDCEEEVLLDIKQTCNPDTIEVFHSMALIAVVGRGLVGNRGIAAKLFTSLAEAGINIRMINQGSSEISIIIGVKNDDYENAVTAIYDRFIG